MGLPFGGDVMVVDGHPVVQTPPAGDGRRGARTTVSGVADGGFNECVGTDVVEAGDGQATVILQVDERHLNAGGSVHGGAIATLADVAMGAAVRSAGGEKVATIEMKVTFLEPGEAGELRAQARVRKKGSRISIVEAEIDQSGSTIAHAIATFTV